MNKTKLAEVIISLSLILSLFLQNNTFAETIVLKSGKTIEGKIIERTDEDITIDFYGVPVPYFLDQIESVDGQKLSTAPEAGKDSVKQHNQEGIQYILDGQFNNAEGSFKMVLEKNSSDPSARIFLDMLTDLNKGIIDKEYLFSLARGIDCLLNKMNKSVETIIELKKAIEINPTYAIAYYILGRAYLEQQEYQQAINYFQKFTQLKTQRPDVYILIGRAYYELGQYSQVKESFQKAIELFQDMGDDQAAKGVEENLANILKKLEAPAKTSTTPP